MSLNLRDKIVKLKELENNKQSYDVFSHNLKIEFIKFHKLDTPYHWQVVLNCLKYGRAGKFLNDFNDFVDSKLGIETSEKNQ